MFKLIINHSDKIGLILNSVGALLLAFAFGTTKEGPMTGTESGGLLKVVHLKRPWFFYIGVGFLVLGFVIQLL